MAEIDRLAEKIEELRQRLCILVDSKQGNLNDPEVMALSAELDCQIVSYQRVRRAAADQK
ncbi:aspartyl-phosphate phosphatase Spo0E family protein [Sporolituus thermophilus]|uniref:Spo0E like sporulation regulatory protein n=1 Tax=Sporolituus thermophilus DSM 23256 TaxID=1123285 RepID=A0A1G7JW71_9FIRM|nr:aspartyl-phosphate phosphatase Spo0E family protein [Sporolituus thermophilus]SDF29218.1 Spo0E like sporulation regulatory protein [Sporolituus thermophilus DSM 23256]